jgi:phosphoglycerate kinase
MKTISDLNLAGKRVLIRADLNVPLNESLEITDDNRLVQFLPTLRAVIKGGGKAIVMSHFGDPKGRDEKLSLKPVFNRLQKESDLKVKFAPDCIGEEVTSMAFNLKDGEVLLLENLRFHEGEKKNNRDFAESLAALGEVYINDAFATAHRAHASMVGVAELIKERAAGYLMQGELDAFNRALHTPKRPLAVILGGAKVSSKLQCLTNIADKADILIIGGAMANTFLAAKGVPMGNSLFEEELFPVSIEIENKVKGRGGELFLPIDLAIGQGLNALKKQIVNIGSAEQGIGHVPEGYMALDIGPKTLELFKEKLLKAKTIVWNGPMGVFENKEFSHGTFGLIEGIVSVKDAFSIVGGGDTDAAIHELHAASKFSYLSTGGGAFLELLEGKELPGIAVLQNF